MKTIMIESDVSKDTLAKLLSLYDENFSPTVKISHSKLKKRIKNRTYRVVTYRNDSEWIGFCLISLNPLLKTIFIDYLCIDKKYQKGGFGKQLLSEINSNKYFPEYKYTILECENYLVSYYQKNQYKKIPLTYPIQNETPLFMLYRHRSEDLPISPIISMHHKFIFYGLLFNGEIIIFYIHLLILIGLRIEFKTQMLIVVILNFKSTHT